MHKVKANILVILIQVVCIIYLNSNHIFAQSNSISWQEHPREYAKELAIESAITLTLFQDSLNTLTSNKEILEATLQSVKDPSKRFALTNQIGQLQVRINTVQNLVRNAVKSAKQTKKLLSLPEDKLLAELAKINKSSAPKTNTVKKDLAENQSKPKKSNKKPSVQATTTTNLPSEPMPDENIEKKSSEIKSPSLPVLESAPTQNRKFNKAGYDLLSSEFNEPEVPCLYQTSVSNTTDKLIKTNQVAPELFFNHTQDQIKKYLKGEDYIKGYAYLGQEPGLISMHFMMEIASDQALRNYGNLGKSIITFKLVDGTEVKLPNAKYDAGDIDMEKKITRMTGIYYLEKGAEKILSSTEIDKLIITFNSGFEEYTVYNVDLIKRQLKCLTKNPK